MKSILKKQKLLIFLTLLLLGFFFYWFELRPSQTRQQCLKAVYEIRDKKKSTDDPLTVSQANVFYRRCFIERGLKPEDLAK